MTIRNKNLFVYIAKCVAGILLCSLIPLFTHWIDYPWSLISVVLVLSPEGNDALELAFIRIKANLVGASTGLLLLFSTIPHPYNIAIGAVLSLIVCDRLKLNAAARSTLASVIIILLHKEGTHIWDSALSRIAAVALGCALGLIVTYAFHSFIMSDTAVENVEDPTKQREG